MSEYTIVINEFGREPRYALYRRDELKATWDNDPLIDNLAYVREQAEARIGASGDDYSEKNVSWKEFPVVMPKAESAPKEAPVSKAEKPAPKAAPASKPLSKVAKQVANAAAKPVVSKESVNVGEETVQPAPKA